MAAFFDDGRQTAVVRFKPANSSDLFIAGFFISFDTIHRPQQIFLYIFNRSIAMDYTSILHELNNASLFDLHRLQSAIYRELLNTDRLENIRSRLKVGLSITYFDSQKNRLIDAVILKIQKTRCLARNTDDGKNWNILFYFINLDVVETDIRPPRNANGIPKISLKLGAIVGFKDRANNELFGEVIRLNPKTATIKTNKNGEWLVHYKNLFSVLDGEAEEVPEQMYLSQVE